MSKIAQIYYYDPQSAGINVESPQSESTPRRLALKRTLPAKEVQYLEWSLCDVGKDTLTKILLANDK